MSDFIVNSSHVVRGVIVSGQDVVVTSGGTLLNAPLTSSGEQHILSGGIGSGALFAGKAGRFATPGDMIVSSRGASISTTVVNGGVLYPVADATQILTVASDGAVIVSGGPVTSGNSLIVSSGQTFSGLTIDQSTTLDILAGGSVNGLVVYGGTVIVDGGVVTSMTVLGGMDPETDATTFGSATIEAGGSAVETIIGPSGEVSVDNAVANETNVSGGILAVLSDGLVIGTTVIDAPAGTEAVSVGEMYIFSGGTAIQTTIGAPVGGTVGPLAQAIVSSGGTAISNTVLSNGYLRVSGGVISDTVTSGGLVGVRPTIISAGEMLSGVTVSAYQNYEIDSGGFATGLTIQPAGTVNVDGGVLQNVTLSGIGPTPGLLDVFIGASALNTTVAGDSLIEVYGGNASNTVLEGISGHIASGEVKSGGSALDTAVLSGGFLAVSSGASTSDLLISGGSAVVSGGAIDDATIIGGTLTLSVGAVTSGTIVFGGNADLVISSGLMPAAVIADFRPTDTIDLAGIAYDSAGSVSFDGRSDVLTVAEGGQSYELKLAGCEANTTFSLSSGDDLGLGSGTILTASVPCFVAGTRILTNGGLVAVEQLQVGAWLRTTEGAVAPIIWIGSRHVECRRHPRPNEILPVCVLAHAFGPDTPARDLLLSPDHAVYAEGVLIPVKYLINGITVVQLAAESVDYFHVELPQHQIILAEGLPVETYLDSGDRAHFGGVDGVTTPHPVFGPEGCDPMLRIDALSYAPLRATGPEIERVQSQLARAATIQSAAG